MTEFYIIALLVTLFLVTHALAFQSASASNQTENKSRQLEQPTLSDMVIGWETHEDAKNGFRIQYPQEWKTVTPTSARTVFDVSSGYAPGGKRQQSSVSVHIEDSGRQLDPATLKVRSTPLEQRADSLIAALGFNQKPNIIKNEDTIFKGEPAWRVDYIMNINGYQAQYGTNIFAYKNDKLYQVDFQTDPLKVEEMRPVGEKIINTFQFTNNTDTFQFTNNTDNDMDNDSKDEESKDDDGIKDCSDFDEINFEVQPGDPYGLDPDGDGIACEA